MLIRIKDLKLRVIVGIYEWEREKPQDVVANVEMEVSDESASVSDDIRDSVDYKELKLKLIEHADKSSYNLIEKLAASFLDIIMENDKVVRASVEIDKPHALRFADSVSVCLARER